MTLGDASDSRWARAPADWRGSGLAALMAGGMTAGVGGALAGDGRRGDVGGADHHRHDHLAHGTGPSEFSQAPAGFDARIALQNAEGGVDGHKIVGIVLDDQTSPTAIATAVQDALSKGAFGIVSDSPLFFLADKAPQQAGRPRHRRVLRRARVGHAALHQHVRLRRRQRGPEVPGQHWPSVTFMKAHGGTVLCSYGYGISPSSTRSAVGTADSFEHAGRQGRAARHVDPLRLGGHDDPGTRGEAEGLQRLLRRASTTTRTSRWPTALKQEGVKPKVMVFPTGFEPS